MHKARIGGENLPTRYEMKVLSKSGQTLWVDHSVQTIQYNGQPATTGTVFDITDRKIAEEKLASKSAFQELVAGISTEFVNANSSNLDSKIDLMLQRCGTFLKVDRTFLFQFSPDLQYMSNTHEWCASGIMPIKDTVQNYPVAEVPWIAEIIRNKQILFVPDVQALPDEYEADKRELLRQQIQSVLVIPIVKNDQLTGYFGFDAVKSKRQLDNEQVQMLQFLALILGDALENVKSEIALQKINMRFDRLASQNRTITWEIDPHDKYTYISPVVKDVLGYEVDEVVGKMYFYDLFPPGEKEIYKKE